ncbi:MAG TPA: lantibiotic dehydratase family protein, partial [Polyangia bacterium]
PSTSLYRAAGRLRYVEGRLDGKLRSYHLVAVEPNEYLDAALAGAERGALLSELTAAVARQAEVPDDEARAFVDELVAQQLLVPELQAPVTGPEPVHALLEHLDGHAAHAPLAAARDAIAAIDAEPLGVATARYRDIAAGLKALPVEAELSRLFQIDLVTRGDGLALGAGVVRELARAIELVHKLARRNDGLAKFREAFGERYESAEVPLAEVLDEESGIGFSRSSAPSADTSPLIAGLAFPAGGGAEREVKWGARETMLLAKLTEALGRGDREIQLDEKDLDGIGSKERPPLPDSFALMATFEAESAAAIDEGRYLLHFGMAGGPSSANLLGRFCHGDAELTARVRDELRLEEGHRPDAIFAEVVHLPEGRVGNVLLRPLLRDYELPFLGASGAPAEQQIRLDDLTVTVDGDRVVLRSRRLGREVVPRLSSAHNYSSPQSLGVYRFLCLLQSQGLASAVGWSWAPFEGAPFLPRVTCGRVVLAPARWRLDRPQLEALGKAKGVERWRAVQALRATRGLPRLIALEDGDN